MELRIKRVYDTPSSEDGKRILVDRLWPRGITKEKACLDAWEKELAPSNELRKWYGHDILRFGEFRERYRQELNENSAAEAFVKRIAEEKGTVTLLFGAKDAEHSNVAVFKEWLEK